MTAAASSSPPQQIDIVALARAGEALGGADVLSNYERIMELAPGHAADLTHAPLTWSATGEWRTPLGGAGQAWLHLVVSTSVPLTCQRCLTPVNEPVEVDRWFRFVKDEATAEREDEDSEEDLLVISKRFDLRALIEDEVLLELPMVPMHGECPVHVKTEVADDAFHASATEPKANPFAALTSLKPGGQA